MAGSNHNPGNGLPVFYCKGQFRCWSQAVKHIGANPEPVQCQSSLFCEQFRIFTVIVCNHYAALHRITPVSRKQIQCQPRCGTLYGIHIHTIAAHTHFSAQPRSAKGQFLTEPVTDFFFIVFDCFQFCPHIRFQRFIIQPLTIANTIFHITHSITLLI